MIYPITQFFSKADGGQILCVPAWIKSLFETFQDQCGAGNGSQSLFSFGFGCIDLDFDSFAIAGKG